MKVPISWLKNYVPVSLPPDELAHRLTMAGIECEAVPLLAEPLDGVVVGRIVEAYEGPAEGRGHAD